MFTSADGKTRLQIRLQDDSLWLTKKQIADLFERSNNTICKFRAVALEGSREVERLK